MKRLLLTLSLILPFFLMQAQDNSSFKTRYNRLYKVGGAAGVGIETVLEQWEAAFPSDRDLLKAKFAFYFTKSRKETVIPLDQARYMGQKPLFELKDSLGRTIRYFSDDTFTDSLYFKAVDALDKAIELFPDDLGFRMERIGATIRHDKESQNLSKSEILSLLDYNAKAAPRWTEEGEDVQEDIFQEEIQNCCFELYSIGSESSYEAFRAVSEKAAGLFPANACFLNDLGVYYLIAKNNPKKAITYYKKVLKINPDDESAAKNIRIAQKKIADGKKKK